MGIFRQPWAPRHPPHLSRKRRWVGTIVGAAEFKADITASVTVTADLTTAIEMAAALSAATSVSANLTTAILNSLYRRFADSISNNN